MGAWSSSSSFFSADSLIVRLVFLLIGVAPLAWRAAAAGAARTATEGTRKALAQDEQ